MENPAGIPPRKYLCPLSTLLVSLFFDNNKTLSWLTSPHSIPHHPFALVPPPSSLSETPFSPAGSLTPLPLAEPGALGAGRRFLVLEISSGTSKKKKKISAREDWTPPPLRPSHVPLSPPTFRLLPGFLPRQFPPLGPPPSLVEQAGCSRSTSPHSRVPAPCTSWPAQ